MTNIIKIPARTQAYLTAERDEVKDVFDVTEFAFKYASALTLLPWGYWKFDETSGDREPSIGGVTMVGLGGLNDPGYAAGLFGNAISLAWGSSRGQVLYAPDGTPDFIEVQEDGKEGPWSVAFWFKVDELTAEPYWAFDYWMAGYYIYFYAQDGRIFGFDSYNCSVEQDLGASDELHFCVVTYEPIDDETSMERVYVDNVLIDSHESYGNWNAGTDFGFENSSTDESVSYIDEFSLWDICLTAEQVAVLWNNGDGLQLAA